MPGKLSEDTFILPLLGQIAPLGATDLRTAIGQAQDIRSAPADEAIGREGVVGAWQAVPAVYVSAFGGSEWCSDGLDRHEPERLSGERSRQLLPIGWQALSPREPLVCWRCGAMLRKVSA